MPDDVKEEQQNVDPQPKAFEFAPTPSGRSLEIISISKPPLPEESEESKESTELLNFAPTPSGRSVGSGRPTRRRPKLSFRTTTARAKTTSRTISLEDRLSDFTKEQDEKLAGSGSFIPTPPPRRAKKKDRKQKRKKVSSSNSLEKKNNLPKSLKSRRIRLENSRKSRTRVETSTKNTLTEDIKVPVKTTSRAKIPVKTTSRTTGETLLRSQRFRNRQNAIRKLKEAKTASIFTVDIFLFLSNNLLFLIF